MLINKTMKELGFIKNYKLTDRLSGESIYLSLGTSIVELELGMHEQIKIVYEFPWSSQKYECTFGKKTNQVVYNKFKKILEANK